MPTARLPLIEPPTLPLDPARPPPLLPVLDIAAFRPEGSDHRPRTGLRLGYGNAGLFGWFEVEDRWLRCVHRGWQAPVWRDSCVEVFLQPLPAGGYFNFEFGAGGALLAGYVTDPARAANGALRAATPLDPVQCARVAIASSLPALIEEEIAEPVRWQLAFHIPFAVLEPFTGPLRVMPGTRWRGNFYKCGDDTSHPHWAAWAPVDELNFHLPRCFGELVFG
jgi:hypothetical protein